MIAGAITASMNVAVSARAVSTSIGRLRPTIPPKADSRGHPAGIGVLDDHPCRLDELDREPKRGVEIEQVRVGQLLPLVHVPLAF